MYTNSPRVHAINTLRKAGGNNVFLRWLFGVVAVVSAKVSVVIIAFNVVVATYIGIVVVADDDIDDDVSCFHYCFSFCCCCFSWCDIVVIHVWLFSKLFGRSDNFMRVVRVTLNPCLISQAHSWPFLSIHHCFSNRIHCPLRSPVDTTFLQRPLAFVLGVLQYP